MHRLDRIVMIFLLDKLDSLAYTDGELTGSASDLTTCEGRPACQVV